MSGFKLFHSGNRTATDRNTMDDTTTVRIFDKLDTISVDVGVIKATMIDRESLTDAISACRANPPRTSGAPSKLNGKFTAIVLGAIGALTATVVALTQLL